MSRHRHFADRVQNLAVGPDDEGGALHAHELAAVHRFFFPNAVSRADSLILVHQEREREAVLGLEDRMGFGRVRADAQDDDLALGERVVAVAEIAGFRGAALPIELNQPAYLKNSLSARSFVISTTGTFYWEYGPRVKGNYGK